METSPLQRRVKAEDLPLDRLATNKTIPEADRRRAAASAFEAVFLRQILETAQKPLITSEFNQESSSSAVYRDMFTSQMADCIARSGQFGLAHSFARQWQTEGAAKAAAPSAPAPDASTAEANAQAQTPTPAPSPTTPPAGTMPASTPLKPLHHHSPLKPYLHQPDLKPYRHE